MLRRSGRKRSAANNTKYRNVEGTCCILPPALDQDRVDISKSAARVCLKGFRDDLSTAIS